MQKSTPRRKPGGFTIVEVLIVLAVTGLLFASAMLLINGKQRVTAFNQSIRNVQTEIQQMANEVASGYYPNGGSITCGIGGGVPSLGNSGTNTQGTNKDCIFLGKVAQFAIGTTDPENYVVYTMVGLTGDSSSPSTDLATSKARVIAKGPTEGATTIPPDAFETKQLRYGLSVSKMYYDNKPDMAHYIGAFGFSSSLASLGTADASQQVNIVAITGSALHASITNGVGQINSNLKTSVMNPPGGIQICFNSGGTDQSGLITVGGENRDGLVGLKIFSNQDCV